MIDITAEGFSLGFHLSFTWKQYWRQRGATRSLLVTVLYSEFLFTLLSFALLATVVWVMSNNVGP